MTKGYYSLGLCGYEIWTDESDPDYMMVLFVGLEREQIARRYKICETPSGRLFVRPNGRRIYLDLVMRCDYP